MDHRDLPHLISFCHSLLYLSLQMQQPFPGNQQENQAREAGSLTTDIAPSSKPPKSKPIFDPSSIPPSGASSSRTSFPVNHTDLILQYPSPLSLLPQSPAPADISLEITNQACQRASRLAKHVGKPEIITLPTLPHVSNLQSHLSTVADNLL